MKSMNKRQEHSITSNASHTVTEQNTRKSANDDTKSYEIQRGEVDLTAVWGGGDFLSLERGKGNWSSITAELHLSEHYMWGSRGGGGSQRPHSPDQKEGKKECFELGS